MGMRALKLVMNPFFNIHGEIESAVMDLIEMVTGNRVNTSFIVFGGVRRDINDAQIARIKKYLDTLEKRMDFYRDLFASILVY